MEYLSKKSMTCFQTLAIIFSSTIIYSQETPLGSKIVGNGDSTNYYIGHFPVAGSDGLDLHWFGGIRFGDWTSNNIMQISSGKIGIGTTTPRAILDVAKNIENGTLTTVFARLPEGDHVGEGTFLGVRGYSTSIINEKSFSIEHSFYNIINSSINFFRGESVTGGGIAFNTNNNQEQMRINANGYVGIGTTIPDEKLTVKGKIHTQEVRVDMAGPLVPDYVFANDYKLRSLQEVEDFIKENKHLPEIPSAQEIEKNGLMLAEMNMSLLKKMEEMTLYMIEQDKVMKAMTKQIEIQNQEIQLLKNNK